MSLKLMQENFIQQLSLNESSDSLLAYLEPCGNLFPDQQLAIYKNNVRGALQTSLAQVYPVCRKILGENYFKQLASVYIRSTPSRHHDLNSYGDSFSDFIFTQCQQRDELNDYLYLSDLVQLEWLYHSVYYAAEGAVFDLSGFANLSEQQQVKSFFQLAPCLKFISSDYPILSIWQINQEGGGDQQTIFSQSESCCVFRKNNQTEMIRVETKVYSLLALIKEGTTLNEIVQKGLAAYLAELINQGWINGFKVSHV